jgi:hypothetical protein
MDESVTGSVNPFSGEGAARTTGVDPSQRQRPKNALFAVELFTN